MKTMHSFKLPRATALVLALLLCLVAVPVLAQSQDLVISLRRDFGYGGGNEIRGTFTISVRGREDLQSVIFLIDGQPMAEADTAAPWELRFQTGNYAFGEHTLTATAVTTSGETIQAEARTVVFATSAQEMAGMRRVLVPILGLVGGIFVITTIVQMIAFRKSKANPLPLGAPRRYGALGGTICPKCHRPFPMHMMSLNFGFKKLERCEHCGKLSLVRALPADVLARAEKAELEWGKPQLPVNEHAAADERKDELDSSKYMEG